MLSRMCVSGALVTPWSAMQEVTGPNPFTVMTNIFVAELASSKIRKYSFETAPFLYQTERRIL